jgi:hypothetical protein
MLKLDNAMIGMLITATLLLFKGSAMFLRTYTKDKTSDVVRKTDEMTHVIALFFLASSFILFVSLY